MRGTLKLWAADGAAAPGYPRRAVRRVAVLRQKLRVVRRAAVLRQKLRVVRRAAAPGRTRRVAYCAAVLAFILLLCGDMVLPPQDPLLPALDVVEQQLRTLTADTPDSWRYSLHISHGPGGAALTADATRRDAFGTWETVHTLWRCENGTWRMVRQTRRTHRTPPGAGEAQKQSGAPQQGEAQQQGQTLQQGDPILSK